METVHKILALLTLAEKKRGVLVLVMVIGLAFLETAGVASVMPFLAVLANPEVVESNKILNAVYIDFSFKSIDSFLFWLGVGAFTLMIVGAGFRTLTQYALYRYTEMRRHTIGTRLLETYLRQPYEFFLNRHTGDLAKSILSEVDELVKNVFQPALNMLAYAVVALVMITFLIIIDPMLAVIVGAVIGGVYFLIYSIVRGILRRTGEDRAVANRERFTIAGEALTGIKDIKVLGRERSYLRRFRVPSTRYARHQTTNATISIIPKYVIEAIGFGGILGLALYLMATTDGIGDILPLLGLYAFAGYRLLPAAQQIYAGLSKLRFGLSAVDEVYYDLEKRNLLSELPEESLEALILHEKISLQDISYTYPGSNEPSLRGLNMVIPIGASIGIVGTTGAGKTTLVDLILGLLMPSEGELRVDEQLISKNNVDRWQRSIGYVPQDIFLSDTTIRENIALGIPCEQIDNAAVIRAAHMAQIDEFITENLPNGYDTMVGERGVRLSGGQRQRLGIARALYHDPGLLIFDEATSALDNATETALIDAISAIQGTKTMITIAHRLSTVVDCDKIYLLKDGGVGVSGTYEELFDADPDFQRLVGVG